MRLFLLLCGCTSVLAQGQVQIPPFQSLKHFNWKADKGNYRPGFLKKLSIESFGISRDPMRLTEGPYTFHGLECQRCIIRSTTERTRYTLPPFGARAAMPLWRDRAELFTGFGGINAWKPDALVTIDRTKSFNDAWLVHGEAGGRIAVDPDRHLWLGVTGRYLQNFGVGKKHWNSVTGTATFQFGR